MVGVASCCGDRFFYQQVLGNWSGLRARSARGLEQRFTFQHDNDHKHIGKGILECFKIKNLNVNRMAKSNPRPLSEFGSVAIPETCCSSTVSIQSDRAWAILPGRMVKMISIHVKKADQDKSLIIWICNCNQASQQKYFASPNVRYIV